MLFDLRSRGRRTTVRGVYLGLAILIGGGLILFGVGTGVGGGGLLNALGGGGSGNSHQALSSADRQAEKAVKAHPNSPTAWAAVVQARWDAAKSNGFDAQTGTFTTQGRTDLTRTAQGWERYLTLTKHPDPLLAIIAARAYTFTNQYAKAASTWEVVTAAESSNPTAFGCLAATAYAAGQTDKGNLASARALSLMPKASQLTLKSRFTAAKASPAAAKQLAQGC